MDSVDSVFFPVDACSRPSTTKFPYLTSLLVVLDAVANGNPAHAAATLDRTPRIAVMSAFEPEWTALQSMLAGRKDYVVRGTLFVTGTIGHKPVVLFKSGISMVNAAMNTQLALDRFTIRNIAFSGIAGGVDPDLEIGDVVVPEAWGEYLETVFARETNGSYALPAFEEKQFANFGRMFPQRVQIATGGRELEKRFWFPADPKQLP